MRTRNELCEHISEDHGIPALIESRTFVNQVKFEEWKSELEQRQNCEFRKPRGKENGRECFECHRSGKYKLTVSSKRAPKDIPTKKVGFTCTAFIRTSTDEEG